jgi:F0F1-type ATP synthase membrane subunit b/b'
VLDQYQRQLADARNESARIIEEARQTAELAEA